MGFWSMIAIMFGIGGLVNITSQILNYKTRKNERKQADE